MNYGEIWCEDITIQIHKSHVKVEKYIKKANKAMVLKHDCIRNKFSRFEK